MTRRITNDEYLSLALRYNEQRTINDSLQREITELKEKNEIWSKYVSECMTDIGRLMNEVDALETDEDKKYYAPATTDFSKTETADEYNERNRIS